MSTDPKPAAGAVSGSASADETLRETNALERAILECADYAIISTTPDGVIRTFNRAAERMLGYAAKEVIGKATPEILHDREEVSGRAAELTAEFGQPVAAGFETFVAKARLGLADEQEWTYVRKDGSRFPVQLSVTAMRDDAGAITGFLGLAHDISRRREAQARVAQLTACLGRSVRERTTELQASEQRYQILAAVAPVGIYHTTADGRCGYVNEHWCELTGRTAAEAQGEGWVKALHPADRAAVFDAWNRAVHERRMFTMEYRYQRPDGRVVWVLGQAAAERDAADAVVGYVGTVTDITERKQAEESLLQARSELEGRVRERTAELGRANVLLFSEIEDRKTMEGELRHREEQLRDLFENATDLIQSVAPDGRILFVNRAWLTTLGYRMGELAALTVFDIIHPDCLAECREQFMRVLRGEALDNLQAVFRAKDGRKVHVEGNASCRFEDGKPVSTRAIFRDITKRKLVEAERERLISELQAALTEVHTLSGLLPVCGWCKKIRDDSGYWNSVEGYLKKSSGVDITHGICPECSAKMMGDLDKVTGTAPSTPPAP